MNMNTKVSVTHQQNIVRVFTRNRLLLFEVIVVKTNYDMVEFIVIMPHLIENLTISF